MGNRLFDGLHWFTEIYRARVTVIIGSVLNQKILCRVLGDVFAKSFLENETTIS